MSLLLRFLRQSTTLRAIAASTNQTLVHHKPQQPLIHARTFVSSSAEKPMTAVERHRHNWLQYLIGNGDLDAAFEVARVWMRFYNPPILVTCNTLMAAMYHNDRLHDVIDLFDEFFKQGKIIPNIVSYNILINAYCDNGWIDDALKVYQQMLADDAPCSPSPETYRHLTKGLVYRLRFDDALDLLREMLNKGHGADSLVYNNVILGFLESDNEAKAIELFDDLKKSCQVDGGVVNATFMDWYFTKGRVTDAMESYKSLIDHQLAPETSNALLEVLLRHDKTVEAWSFFDQMLDNHTPPDFEAVNSDTFNIMVNACMKLAKFAEAIETFKRAGTKPGSKPFAMDVAGYSNIIAKFCGNGLLKEAEQLLEEMSRKELAPDVNIYQAFIEAYFRMKRAGDALQMFNRLVDSGLRVPGNFAKRVFKELVRKGKAGESAPLLLKMGEKEIPDPTTYEIVIKELCKEGLLDSSRELIGQLKDSSMGFTPSLLKVMAKTFREEKQTKRTEMPLVTNEAGILN